ncbi:MAG: ribonucleotide reductase, partial [Verrucomicrobia bacterium]|nr:ribonucleotide reductase [Verrucomicrobiota bacterium]
FLAIHCISYEEFGNVLELLTGDEEFTVDWDNPAMRVALALEEAIDAAAEVARAHNMERAFCIAPTASCSYRYLDSRGFTTAPEIAPPTGRIVDRDSGTFGVEQFNYGEVEIAEEVDWETFKKVANGVVSLYQRTGLFHGYSFNSWNDMVVYDRAFLRDWLESPQTSLYYSLQVLADVQRKDDAYAALDDSFKDMFGIDRSNVENQESVFCSRCAE